MEKTIGRSTGPTDFLTQLVRGHGGKIRYLCVSLLLTLVILLPRLLALDHFVNNDERKWLARSGNFYRALTLGDYANTFQREHPGVTIMWAGAAGFWWHYATYATDVPGYLEWDEEIIGPFLHSEGHEALDLLIAARIFVVAMNTIALLIAFLLAIRLLGWLPAVVGFLLIAFDPFHIALSRMLHLDGLMASFIFLSLLAFLSYLDNGRRKRELVLAGIAGGLAWLTKSPSFFLIPFLALLVLAPIGNDSYYQRASVGEVLRQATKVLVGWGLVALVTYVLFWPALWVNPFGAVKGVFSEALLYASEGHDARLYFNGRIFRGDPGFFFYIITYLWRITPAVLLGLIFALIAFVTKQAPLNQAKTRRTTTVLFLFALLFMLFMGLGSKKADRYLIPIYLPLDLIAALGWLATVQFLKTHLPIPRIRTIHFQESPSPHWPGLREGVLAAVLALQAFGTLSVFPHFISYYNPLLGGSARAPDVMQIGWGEGLDEAARYLNQKPSAENLHVSAWYDSGSFSYFFKGKAERLSFHSMKNISTWFNTDYIVLYIQQRQRELLYPAFLEYFDRQTPEHRIQLNDIDYAQIYKISEISPPDFMTAGQPRFTDWDDAIRLVDYELPSKALSLGDSWQATFYLENIAPLEQDVSVLMRVVGPSGELLRDEGWPYGSPTSKWELHEIWRDGHDFTIPADAPTGYYQIMLSFYEPETLSSLPATNTYTGEPLEGELLLDYLYVGQFPSPPSKLLQTKLGADIRLLGAKIEGMEQQAVAKPNEALEIELFWQTEAILTQDYTVFVHLVGPDAQLVAQQDQPPPVATHLWRPDDVIVARTTLTLSQDALPGTYELRVGMYDPTTVKRLTVSENGEIIGDYVTVRTIQVE